MKASIAQAWAAAVALVVVTVAGTAWVLNATNVLRSETKEGIAALKESTVSKADFAEVKSQLAALTVAGATTTVRLEQTTKALEDLKKPRR